MVKIIIGVSIASILAYLDGGGWLNNGYELLQNYRHSKLSVLNFIHLLFSKRK